MSSNTVVIAQQAIRSSVSWANQRLLYCEIPCAAARLLTVRLVGRKEMFYLTTHSTHFILRLYGVGHMVKDHSDSERGNPLPPHRLLFPINSRQDSIYHGLCYISRGALAGTRNSSMGPPHEGSIRRPIAPWASALTTELHLTPGWLVPVLSKATFKGSVSGR